MTRLYSLDDRLSSGVHRSAFCECDLRALANLKAADLSLNNLPPPHEMVRVQSEPFIMFVLYLLIY